MKFIYQFSNIYWIFILFGVVLVVREQNENLKNKMKSKIKRRFLYYLVEIDRNMKKYIQYFKRVV